MVRADDVAELVRDPFEQNRRHEILTKSALPNPLRGDHTLEMASVGKEIEGLHKAELVARLDEGRIAYGFVNSVADLVQHPQLRRYEVATPTGAVSVVAPPARSSTPRPEPGLVPALDAHGAALRKEFGA